MRRRNLLSRQKLESLTTPRLLAYRKSLLKVYEDDGGNYPNECIWHKQTPEWQEHYALVKEILATREHRE